MSQVMTPQDKLTPGRDRTRKQEHEINREDLFKKWRRNDISKGYGPITKLIGIGLLPFVAIWSVLTAVATAAVWLSVSASRGVGNFFHLFSKK